MFPTAYSTTAASPFYTHELTKSLLISVAEGILDTPDASLQSCKALVDRGPRSKTIPPFDHPVLLEQKTGNLWIVDMRPYATRIVAQDGTIILPAEGPVALLMLRAKLEMYWNQYAHGEVLFWGDLPLVVFSRWITSLLKNRLNLEPHDVERTLVVAASYYFNLFYADKEWGPKQMDSAAIRINRVLGIDIGKVKNIVSQLPYMANLEDFTNSLRTVVDSPSMRVIDTKYLYLVAMGSWFGSADTRSLIGVALEYPPAFIAMVLSAGNTQYKKTIIGELVEREKSKHRFGQFQQVVNNALRSLK